MLGVIKRDERRQNGGRPVCLVNTRDKNAREIHFMQMQVDGSSVRSAPYVSLFPASLESVRDIFERISRHAREVGCG